MIFNSNISKRESDVNLSDATATSSDILSGKTAYGASGKIVGTLVPGTDTSDATATSSDILSGKTAYTASGKVSGSMINRGAINQTLSAGSSYTIPAGYHNGFGKVTASASSMGDVTEPLYISRLLIVNNTQFDFVVYYNVLSPDSFNEYTKNVLVTTSTTIYAAPGLLLISAGSKDQFKSLSSSNSNVASLAYLLNYAGNHITAYVKNVQNGTATLTVT